MPSLQRRLLLLLLLGALLAPAAASATALDLIQPLAETRRSFAGAQSQTGPQFSQQTNENGSVGDFAPLSFMVDASAPTDGANATAHASHASSISGDLISASSALDATTLIMEGDASASSDSQSLIEIFFSVETTSLYDLSGLLETSVSGDGEADIFVELAADFQTVFLLTADMGDDLTISETGVLSPGVQYRLTVLANANARGASPGSDGAASSFDLDFLVMVPEPTSASLLGAALFAVAIRRRACRAPGRCDRQGRPRGAGGWRALVGAVLLFSQASCGGDGEGADPPVVDPSDATLRELAIEEGFDIGTAFDGWQFEDLEWRDVVTREFTLATVNWGVYWGEVEPARDQFDFAVIDQQVDFAEANAMRIRGHALYFPSASPTWLEDPALSDEELEEILRNHVEVVVSRYRGRIHEWVVVNEPYLPTYREEDVLYGRFGYDYVEMAFEAARAADPGAVLIFNDTDNHLAVSETTDLTRQIVSQLEARSLIDGVGLQMHLAADDLPDKQEVIDTLQSYGVPVYVTEFDVDLRSVSGTELERFLLQGSIYQDMLEACRESGVCESFTVWGINDRYSWLEWPEGDPAADPTPFDETLRRKPAWAGLARVLAGAAP